MKSILFVLDYYLPHRWGVENVFENIILRLIKKWYKIIILTSKYDKNLKEHERDWDIEIYRKWKSRIWFMWAAIKLWKQILQKNNIDIIHASTYGWAIPASILWKKFQKKVILTVHEVFWKLWFKYKWLLRWFIYKIFELIIFKFKYSVFHCVSYNTAKELQKYYWIKYEEIEVIHNWVDTNFWNSRNVESKEIFEWRKTYKWNENFVFLYFGHAGKSKGIDYLIKALPEILKLENVMVVFNIIESKRTNKILEELKNIKVNNLQIFNWFSKTDLRKLIASCDCVIAPSVSEWFGSVHTESIAMWKILITSKTSAIPEVVYWKVKFIKHSDKDDIVSACRDVIKWNIEEIPEKKFNWDETVEKIEKLYFVD
jgi:glycosyltransferase involved in cell wall biosynthesis